MSKKLIVFDWNGVIIADTLACLYADNMVLKAFRGKPVNLKTYRETFRIPANDFYAMQGADKKELAQKSKKCGDIFHEYYEKRVSRIRTRKNIKKVLEWLKRNNFESVILSNHTIKGIDNQLIRLKIKDYFLKVLATSDKSTSMKKKSKFQKLKSYLKGYNKNKVFIIGDSPEEVEIGRKLGIKRIALTGGYFSNQRLKQSNPDYMINNLKEIINILKKCK
ncbi:HAD hydrolase-like protein [Candidatus Woesearchaeota archaeon]|nr:HAD hydrolase-like protein [Candidatus Woesearchaeota archaeon]